MTSVVHLNLRIEMLLVYLLQPCLCLQEKSLYLQVSLVIKYLYKSQRMSGKWFDVKTKITAEITL